MFEHFDNFVNLLDYSLDSRRKRHIAGGILLSVALLFGGLAFTAMSLKEDEKEN